jgi:uncharacterized protein
MVEVAIDSVRISLMSQHRIIVLKDLETSRFLPIWIGPFEADAITIELQGVEVPRPLTHDLLRSIVDKLGAEVEHVAITDLRNDTFYAEISLKANGTRLHIDSRPSDAIALAVRTHVPVFVAEQVMDQAAIIPEPDLEGGESAGPSTAVAPEDTPEAFRDFLEGLDLGDLGN